MFQFAPIQMGGIDEAALDRLSLVTEMTKHIRVRASGGKSTASELGQFSPIFVWLLRVMWNMNISDIVFLYPCYLVKPYGVSVSSIDCVCFII